jgi:hypothetical protein
LLVTTSVMTTVAVVGMFPAAVSLMAWQYR